MGQGGNANKEKKQNNAEEYPTPYNQIRHTNTGTILGKQINMHGRQMQEIRHRLKKSKNTRGMARGNYSRIQIYQKS